MPDINAVCLVLKAAKGDDRNSISTITTTATTDENSLTVNSKAAHFVNSGRDGVVSIGTDGLSASMMKPSTTGYAFNQQIPCDMAYSASPPILDSATNSISSNNILRGNPDGKNDCQVSFI